jgi:VCBS repeat protein
VLRNLAALLVAGIAAVLIVGSAAALTPTFTQIEIPVGNEPGSVAVVDLNRDGKLDIVVANMASESMSILLGDGKGHFQPSPGSPFPVGHLPNDVAIGDFNGDGNLDLLIPNTQTPYLTILLGDGTGRFQAAPHSPFATQSQPHPHGAAVADFNGDGKLDVMIDSWGRNQVNLLLGDGKGNLIAPGQFFNVGKRPYQRLRSADFNKDGKPDVVTTNLDGSSVTVLLGDGRGGFQEAAGSPFATGPAPWAVAIDDLNKDGNLDLVTIPYAPVVKDPKQIGVSILFGDGKGGFAQRRGALLPLEGCRGPDRLATGDINGDGFRDIVVSCAQSNNLELFVGSKDGTFQVSLRDVPDLGFSGLAVADLNGDGKDDIVVANNKAGKITILFSK